jgi:hypothetical protein
MLIRAPIVFDCLGERLVQGHGSIPLHGGLAKLPYQETLVVLLCIHFLYGRIFGHEMPLNTTSMMQACSGDDSQDEQSCLFQKGFKQFLRKTCGTQKRDPSLTYKSHPGARMQSAKT